MQGMELSIARTLGYSSQLPRRVCSAWWHHVWHLIQTFMHCRCSPERDKELKESKEAKEKKQKKQRKAEIAPFVNARRTAIWLTMRGWAIVTAIDTGVC